MKRNRGFTLLEVQISSMLMIVILIATGVIFYFALASIRYMHDAFSVYTNATTAMKLITDEVMRANCYGSGQFPAAATLPDSFYGPGGYIQAGAVGTVSNEEALNSYGSMPTLGDVNDLVVTNGNYGSGLYLRQATQASSIRGESADVAGDFPWHEIVQIYRILDTDPDWTRYRLRIERSGRSGTTDMAIADNVTQFDFQPISYNSLAVTLTVTGTVVDPMSMSADSRHTVTLTKQITLRCAPSMPPIPGASGTSW